MECAAILPLAGPCAVASSTERQKKGEQRDLAFAPLLPRRLFFSQPADSIVCTLRVFVAASSDPVTFTFLPSKDSAFFWSLSM